MPTRNEGGLLGSRDRERSRAYVLHERDGLSYREIARRLQRGKNYVMKLIHEAKDDKRKR